MWQPRLILQDGELIPFADARVHPLSLGMAYATTVFEGLRAYRADDGSYSLFRLAEHIRRLQAGMKLMRFDRTITVEEIRSDLARLIHANEPDTDVYIRLLVYIGGVGLMATRGPVNIVAAASPRDKPKFAESGMKLGVSSWSRLADNASPPRIKATANYHNARLTQLQAQADGYDGALMLTPAGKVSEAPIACFFMVRDGELITPRDRQQHPGERHPRFGDQALRTADRAHRAATRRRPQRALLRRRSLHLRHRAGSDPGREHRSPARG